MIKTTLFVCRANVGRSQIAEGYYNFFTKDNKAISAGIQGNKHRDLYDNHPAHKIISLMGEEGIDISKQTIDQLSSELVQKVDRVVVLCSEKECSKKLLKGAREIVYAHISDPYGHSFERMREIRDEIKELVINLVKS